MGVFMIAESTSTAHMQTNPGSVGRPQCSAHCHPHAHPSGLAPFHIPTQRRKCRGDPEGQGRQLRASGGQRWTGEAAGEDGRGARCMLLFDGARHVCRSSLRLKFCLFTVMPAASGATSRLFPCPFPFACPSRLPVALHALLRLLCLYLPPGARLACRRAAQMPFFEEATPVRCRV